MNKLKVISLKRKKKKVTPSRDTGCRVGGITPTTNVYEVTTKRALLNFAIIQDIPFDVGRVIEDAILYNRDAKMNLGHPFLIYGLCKKAGVSLEDNEA